MILQTRGLPKKKNCKPEELYYANKCVLKNQCNVLGQPGQA